MIQDLETIISNLTRQQCENLLESACIAVYPDESISELREAISANSKDGTLRPIDIRMEATS